MIERRHIEWDVDEDEWHSWHLNPPQYHKPVLFETDLAYNTVRPCATAKCCRVISPSTAVKFSSAFSQKRVLLDSEKWSRGLQQMVWLHLSNGKGQSLH